MTNALFAQAKDQAAILLCEKGIDYSTADIGMMADAYCDASDSGDARAKNLYMSALMLRFWYVVGKLEAKSQSARVEREEFAEWLYESIEYACKYRAWRNPAKKVNARQAINQCIETIRLQKYYVFNHDKNKTNYLSSSLDAQIDMGESQSSRVLDALEDESESWAREKREGALSARGIVQRYVGKKKLIEAIILDTIAFADCQKEVRRKVEFEDSEGVKRQATAIDSEFWPYKCVQSLNELPDDYEDYFLRNYNAVPEEVEAAVEAIRKANNQKLYKYLRSCLAECKKDPKLAEEAF